MYSRKVWSLDSDLMNFFNDIFFIGNKYLVVLIVVSGILFARFRTVKCIPTICSFLLMSITVEARNKRVNIALSAFYLNTVCSSLQHTH